MISKSKDFSGAILIGVDLSGMDLRDADFSGADLRWAYLNSANLHNADFSGADLRWAYLNSANLHNADFNNANLRGANFNSTDLSYARFNGADLIGADLRCADLDGAKGVLSFVGPQHPAIAYLHDGVIYVKIGCTHDTVDWWLDNYQATGEENGYTQNEIEVYHSFLLIAKDYNFGE